ncbi:GlcNAc-PI de-N-acetylase [Lentzea sp. NBRC 105346]|uniref:PIG-L deacetylase family protein n=1 Tax=Lentzea sp. NBRC 105346 TaxID=3032205 RepID=UPI0024A4D8A8|nr:PIG-L family deacetylase [Lentzea sp. NBRC 105346]GLZ28295.1 GlcNAc-PI de-N-acetylase [Lentzea sp. NBRC 105346]
MTTIVAFHAHPDDEVLLTGGTLARAGADGHRVVVVVATDGIIGEHTEDRLNELRTSAAILGVHRVVCLGYADSGHGPLLYDDPPDRTRFVRAPVEEAAGRLAEVLREESASVLISYDANGGYGHRDHVQVHHVGARAAQLAGVTRVLEATMPRELVRSGYTPRAQITHSFNVRGYARKKRAALAAHASQLHRGRSGRIMRLIVRLPLPLFALLLGREWFRTGA